MNEELEKLMLDTIPNKRILNVLTELHFQIQ